MCAVYDISLCVPRQVMWAGETEKHRGDVEELNTGNTSYHTYGMRSGSTPQTSNSNKLSYKTFVSLCHLPT